MKINILYKPQTDKCYDVKKEDTFLTLYRSIKTEGYPLVFQIGGALGPIYRHDTINYLLLNYEKEFYEPYINFMDEFCPVDYMRFMCRFLMRNLNIVNEKLIDIYNIIQGMTDNTTKSFMLQPLKDMLKESPKSLGEKLLYNNLNTLLSWYEDDILEHLNGHCKHSVCRSLLKAQCINACPANIHIPGFVALMKEERYTEAYSLMRKENPLNSVCGYVCARPCERKCRRGEITGTVGVRALQRFISSEALKKTVNETCLESNGKHIGILGGGPSGLTAAYYLKRTGYDVTIYEKEKHLGGLLAFGVPEYRLPLHSIEEEIETILSLGIQVKLNTKVGHDVDFKTLQSRHDKLILSTGRPKGNSMVLEHDHVITAIDFLKKIRQGTFTDTPKNVVVIGGGDVAMDCSRTSKRIGAEVTLISLESYDKMPASDEEKIQAQAEGVNFLNGYGIKNINNHLVNLNTCTEVFDCYHKFNPQFTPTNASINQVDLIILAIGQKEDLTYLPEEFQDELHKILDDKVFACGDLLKATIVIDAIAQGKEVALKLHQSFGGKELFTGDKIQVPERLLNIKSFDYDRREIKTLLGKSNNPDFDLVNQNYSVEDALFEAERCMRCDQNSVAPLLLGRNNQ